MNLSHISVIEPKWQDSVVIGFGCSKEFIPYLEVCLHSLLDNIEENTKYEIIIFVSDCETNSIKKINKKYSKCNICINFYDPSYLFKQLKLHVSQERFNISCYYRIFAPFILKKYKKFIFADTDLIFKSDIKKLFETSTNGYPLAACVEPLWDIFIKAGVRIKDIDLRSYTRDVLKLKKEKYFNTGVVLVDNLKFHTKNWGIKLLECIEKNDFLFQEQDAINYILKGNILELDKSWNFEVNTLLANYYNNITPSVIHYVGDKKPWKYKDTQFSEDWWKVAEQCTFYELIKESYYNRRDYLNNINVKIFVTYKENKKLIKTNIIFPIQAGTSLSKVKFHSMYYDNYGDNISLENLKYSELSALYCLWKNYLHFGNPDYIGHMHYRRHFILKDNVQFNISTPPKYQQGFSLKFVDGITPSYLEQIGLDDTTIKESLYGRDGIVVKQADVRYLDGNCKVIIDDYLKHVPGSQLTDIEELVKILLEKFPEYEVYVNLIKTSPYRFFYYMFIMKKELFFELMNLLFSVLPLLDSKIDYSRRGTRGGRVLGYMGEILFSLFIQKKISEGSNIKQVYASFLLNTPNVPICRVPACHSKCLFLYYVKRNESLVDLFTSIYSLDQHIITNNKNDLCIAFDSVEDINCLFLKELKLNNFNIFYICTSEINSFNLKLRTIDFLKYFSMYNNIILCDPKLLFIKDTDFTPYFENVCTGLLDPFVSDKLARIENYNKYLINIIGLDNLYNYFVDSLLVLNTTKALSYIKDYSLIVNMSESLLRSHSDVLNFLYKDAVSFFPCNFTIFSSPDERKKYFTDEEYIEAQKQSNSIFCAEIYKNSSKNITCFYNYIKSIYLDNTFRYIYANDANFAFNQNLSCQNIDFRTLFKTFIKYKKYSVLSKVFIFGKKRKHYLDKKLKYKNLLKIKVLN